MNNKIGKNDLTKQENNFPELHLVDPEELPPIIISAVVTNELQNNQNALAGNVPLFIKKLWKMVNDDKAEEIISWSSNCDGFIIHDQLKFVSQMLPKYFKHNHLSSFVRQLNLYDFHKIQNVEKEEFQFSHPCFLKDVPQLLPLIKRKAPSGRQKSTTNESEPSAEVQEVANAVKDIKNKSDVISNELSKLRQENAALWSEMNSLRVKYSKQTKIINKLIHFLISYMQKHHNARKTGRTVSTSNANKYLKTGPKIMELDYRYKNNPHEFWTEFDNRNSSDQGEQEAYTVVEPAESNMETDSQALSNENNMTRNITLSSAIEELLPGSSAFNQSSGQSVDPRLPPMNYSASQPSSSKRSNSALQRAGGSKENLSYLIDNTQVELNTIKELLKNLPPEELTNFYKLVNDNYKNQEDNMPLNVSPEPEMMENELIELAQMSPFNTIVQEQDLALPLDTHDNVEDLAMPFETNEDMQNSGIPFEINDETIQDLATTLDTNETVPNLVADQDDAFSIAHDESLGQDNLLNNISVDEFFN